MRNIQVLQNQALFFGIRSIINGVQCAPRDYRRRTAKKSKGGNMRRICMIAVLFCMIGVAYAKEDKITKPSPSEIQDQINGINEIMSDLTFRVNLTVTADDPLGRQVRSYIGRELRALGDVIQTESDYTYVIEVVGVSINTGREKGYALSIVIKTRFSMGVFKYICSEGWKLHSKSFHEIGQRLVFESGEHLLRTGPMTALQEACRGVVAYFDAEKLQYLRDANQETWDMLLNDIRKP